MDQKKADSGTRTERKKEATRQNILDVAMKIFKAQGVHTTTMEQIAEAADIAKGTLYNYFPVKEAIIDEIMKRAFRERHGARIEEFQQMPDTRSRMIFIFTILIEGIQDNRELYETYTVYRMKSMASLRQEDSVKSGLNLLENAIIEMGHSKGEIRRDYPDFIVRDLFEFAFVEAVKQFYMDPDSYDIRESVEKCVDIFIDWAGKTT
ncbi:MAG: TetR/AcrR family transcriptional regulator [Ignavibacteriales bacterium]